MTLCPPKNVSWRHSPIPNRIVSRSTTWPTRESTAGAVTYGSAEDTRQTVRETLETMMPGGGYALAPTHQLQDNSPTENVVAMYEAAIEFGAYA